MKKALSVLFALVLALFAVLPLIVSAQDAPVPAGDFSAVVVQEENEPFDLWQSILGDLSFLGFGILFKWVGIALALLPIPLTGLIGLVLIVPAFFLRVVGIILIPVHLLRGLLGLFE